MSIWRHAMAKLSCTENKYESLGAKTVHLSVYELHVYTQRNLFEILLNQSEIRLYLLFSDWFGTKRTCPFAVPDQSVYGNDVESIMYSVSEPVAALREYFSSKQPTFQLLILSFLRMTHAWFIGHGHGRAWGGGQGVLTPSKFWKAPFDPPQVLREIFFFICI